MVIFSKNIILRQCFLLKNISKSNCTKQLGTSENLLAIFLKVRAMRALSLSVTILTALSTYLKTVEIIFLKLTRYKLLYRS